MPYLSAKNHLQISVNVMKLILRVSLLQATKYADNHSILLSYVGEKSWNSVNTSTDSRYIGATLR